MPKAIAVRADSKPQALRIASYSDHRTGRRIKPDAVPTRPRGVDGNHLANLGCPDCRQSREVRGGGMCLHLSKLCFSNAPQIECDLQTGKGVARFDRFQ